MCDVLSHWDWGDCLVLHWFIVRPPVCVCVCVCVFCMCISLKSTPRQESWNRNIWGNMSIVNVSVSVKIFSAPSIETQSGSCLHSKTLVYVREVWWFQDWLSSAAQLCHQNPRFFPLCHPQCFGCLPSWRKIDDCSRFSCVSPSGSHNLSLSDTHTNTHNYADTNQRLFNNMFRLKKETRLQPLWSF